MDVIERLGEAEGNYLGSGEETDGTEFRGELEIRRAVDGAGISLLYTSRDDRGRMLRQEQMLIGYTRDSELFLWGLDSATERIRQHSLIEAANRDGRDLLCFGSGQRDNRHIFREEITFAFEGDDVEIEFARGRPGEPFGVHSTVRLVPKAFYSLRDDSKTTDVAYREFDEKPETAVRSAVEGTAERLSGPERNLDLGRDRAWSDGEHTHLAVAELDDTVAGFRLLGAESPHRAVVRRAGVIPEMHESGIGSELLLRQLEWARRRGYRIVRSQVPADEQRRLITLLEEDFEIVHTTQGDAGRRTFVVLDHDLLASSE